MPADEATIQTIDDELKRLQSQIEAKEAQIGEDATKIIGLLAADLPAYLKREVKARFLSAPQFAERMPSETLAALKREIEDEGKKTSADLVAALRNPGLWLLDIDPSDATPLELPHVTEVWQHTTRIDRSLERLLAKYGFPSEEAGRYRCEYQPPTWFISGALLKTLLEAYQAHLIERAKLCRSVARLEAERRTRQLDLKWEAAR
jgi:hypothetical protein